jgi:phage-related protein
VSKRSEPKPCIFIGPSLKDLKRFPATVQNRVGYALNQVQEGEEPIAAKALKGFGGRTVLELTMTSMEIPTGRLNRAFCRGGLRAACFPEESEKGRSYTAARH